MLSHRWQWKRSLLVLVLALPLLPSLILAQSATLKGKVTDAQTKEGLPGANVVVTAEGKAPTGAAADPSGDYTVPNLAAGTYTVSISFIGYEKKETPVTLAAGETKVLDLALEPTGINLNPIVVSASRRQEKVLEAPASIAVLEATQIRGKPTLTPAEHLRNINGVDMAQTGLSQSNVVTRGFNNIFSGALLTLTDNRISHVPSLRLNANNFLTFTNEDIERVEVVLGPGAALYGPNSANGVLHFLTRSPFDSKGTSVSVGGGARAGSVQGSPGGDDPSLDDGGSVAMTSIRHAGVLSDKIGYKISAQYYQGDDWEYHDPVEEAARATAIANGANPDTLKIGARDFNIEKFAGEGRLDYRATPDMTVILNGGYNQADNLEPTGIGAGLAQNWRYYYVQSRLLYKNLFLQGFVNSSNAGDTYLLRTGAPIVDDSKLYVGQAQHFVNLGQRQRFTYGLDVLLTRPNTEGTINGRHENEDGINEYGVYVQSDTKLSPKLDFVAALRFDDHEYMEDPVLSPRAALVFKANTNNTLRVTYNRAFGTPSSNNLFLDLLAASQPTAAINPGLVPFIGPTLFNVYAEGTAPRGSAFPRTSSGGFHFNYGADGRAQMVSYFGPMLVQAGAITDPNAYLVPDVNSVWPALRQLIAGSQPLLAPFLPANLGATVPGIYRSLNTETRSFDLVKNPQGAADIVQIKPTINNTFELGYKGVIGNKLTLSVDVYYSQIKDFVGPLIAETPHVFMDTTVFAQVLAQDLVNNGYPQLLNPLATAQSIARAFGGLPLGLTSPIEDQSPTTVILTYRNFGDVSLGGGDLSFSYYANRNWVINGNYSYVSKDFFPPAADQPHPIALNSPQHKIGLGLQYRIPQLGFDAELRGRYSEGFPMNSGVYIGHVQTYTVFDANLGYDLSFLNDARLSVNIQNILNNKHREFVGVPELGRLVITRLTYSF